MSQLATARTPTLRDKILISFFPFICKIRFTTILTNANIARIIDAFIWTPQSF